MNNCCEISAIKISPTPEEIQQFDVRTYNDCAISYVGDYHFKNNAKEVRLVLDIDEFNNVSYREKTDLELTNDSYLQKKEVLEYLKSINKLKKLSIESKMEFMFIANGLFKLLKDSKLKLIKTKKSKNDRTRSEIDNLVSIKKRFEELKNSEIDDDLSNNRKLGFTNILNFLLLMLASLIFLVLTVV